MYLARRLAAGILALPVAALVLSGSPARADTTSAPAWAISSTSLPTNFAPGSSGNVLKLIATNAGGAPTAGDMAVSDTLPTGLTPTAILGMTTAGAPLTCSLVTLTCALEELGPNGHGPLLPGDMITVYIQVAASAAPATLTNTATVSGGGALSATTTEPTAITAIPAPFGIQSFTASANDADGSLSTQAGGVPYAATASFALNTVAAPDGRIEPAENLKDTVLDLPAGFVGNPLAGPRCAAHEFPSCTSDTQVGMATVQFANVQQFTVNYLTVPIYNMAPPAGTPAELKFIAAFGQATLVPRLRTGGDYGITIDTRDNSEATTAGGLAYVSVTLWGIPGDRSHDAQRGRLCLVAGQACGPDPKAPFGDPVEPFLTNPTYCGPPLTTTLVADSWQTPGDFLSAASVTPTGTTGCGKLSFTPTVTLQPDTSVADTPTGLHVDVHVPRSEDPSGLAQAALKKAVVTLPEGVTVNPAAAAGLSACGPAQIDLPGPGAATCPDASKIGSVQLETPLIDHPLPGAVYLAQQGRNPFGSLLAIYITIDDPASGVVVKLAGHVVANPQTGQLTTTFDNNPQLPFEDLRLDFFDGPRAALSTPETCGTFQAASALSPWSAADPNNPTAAETSTSSDTFEIRSGCVKGFAPSFIAGSLNPAAGASSAFNATFSRSDQDQDLGAISLRMPPGLLGRIAGVQLCREPQAAAGTCPPASQIGHVTVAAGAGASPISLPEAGKPQDPVFLTGPYKSAPFGLSVAVPAEAGPFNLGTVVVRAALYVDPHSAQVTVVSDPLPQMLQGIPLKLRTIDVTVDRPGFMLNPTSCYPMSVEATIRSDGGLADALASRFQVADCSTLPFKPVFAVTTAGNGNVHGASLDVKITQRPGEAAIHTLDTQLPRALPSRLATLQKACPEALFAANPATCPAGADVGFATAITPLLNVPLTGPAYLVSHGGAAFPDLDIVLQGEGVEIVLTGRTDIKRGVTYSRFETVPDAPISSFELRLHGGTGALLAATRSLCAPAKTLTIARRVSRRPRPSGRRVTAAATTPAVEPLIMPTRITAQNSAVASQTTRITVTDCSPSHPRRRSRARRAHGRGSALPPRYRS
jgi:hypothetical protein